MAKQPILTLDIGSHALKLAEFTEVRGGLEMTRYAVSDLGLDPQSDADRSQYIITTIHDMRAMVVSKPTSTTNTISRLTATMPSCVDLEEHPESNLTTNQFYNNAGDANAAVSAIYSGMNPSGQSLFRTLLQIGMEMATDDYEAGPRARNAHVRAISNVVYDAGNNRFQEMWRVSYDNINRANIAIDKIAEIPSAEISDELRAQYINEAKFLRAIYYFNLVRWFREVPLVLHETTSLDPASIYVAQATEDEVYEQIIQDLTDAEQLPTSYGSVDVGRATSGAASSLLSKVYLTRGQWALAESKSLEVIRSSRYSLFENYADVWSLDHENGQEHIFVIPFKGNANFVGNDLALRAATTEVPGINGEYNKWSVAYISRDACHYGTKIGETGVSS